MNIKVTVNRKIVVNGKEYGSPEEMPEALRHAYERAMAGGLGAAGLAGLKSRIMFQGKEYQTPANMPDEVRKLYDLAVAAANLDEAHSGTGGAMQAGPVERDGVFVAVSTRNPEDPASSGQTRGFSIRLSVGRGGLLVLLVLLLGVFWYVLTAPGSVIR